MGIIPQNYILFDHRTIEHNLHRGLSHCGKKYTKKDAKNIIHKHAEDFGLAEHLTKYPPQLSGGQRQRVSIIQQILTDNKFILLDEPLSGLDRFTSKKVVEMLLKVSLLSEYNTLIIVSHDIVTAMAIADTVMILAKEPDKDGATITSKIDLMQMGLAWDPEILKNPEFHKVVSEVESLI